MTGNHTPDQGSNWKNKAYLTGGMMGLTVGLIAAYLYVRVADENGAQNPGQIKTMDIIGLAVAMLALIRQITDLGAKNTR